MTESALAVGQQQPRHPAEAGKNARRASRAVRVPTQPGARKGRLPGRLVIVSNRLPVALRKDDSGEWQSQPSPGGLVTALAPVLRDKGGVWIGWPGVTEAVDLGVPLSVASKEVGYTLRAVPLTHREFDQYYCGFSNEILWPLFHDLQSRCNFDPAYWKAYRAVNRRFAEVVAENARPNDYIWVHDYHLLMVARELRAMGLKNRVAFFLHTPFPALDICLKLPWRAQVLEGLLEYDLVGFQTWRDRNNFIQCVEALVRGLHVDARMRVSKVTTAGREVHVGSFPISIDFKEFARQGAEESLVREVRRLREAMKSPKIILGVDRLDYSKGIPQRLEAFENALHRFPDLRGKVSLVEVVSPSRADIPEYRRLKVEIERLVGQINGKFTQPGWIPVHYIYRSLGRRELVVYYRAADVALITPLKDGMNLIAKEYCASNVDADGVIILSEFAGAASQLRRHALLVNPYDIESVANAIHRACSMSEAERQLRMTRLRQSIATKDVFRWVDSFLGVAGAAEIGRLEPIPRPVAQRVVQLV